MSDRLVRLEDSELDTARWGVPTTRAAIDEVGDVAELVARCLANNTRLLILRCPVSQIRTVQEVERHGGRLMDTLVTYTRNLDVPLVPPRTDPVSIRLLRNGEELTVEAVASEAFRGYFGHYHADPLLDPIKCDGLYASWALNLANDRDASHEVYVSEIDGQVVGFVAVRQQSQDVGEGVLLGVSVPHMVRALRRRMSSGDGEAGRGGSIYKALMTHAINWSLASGASRFLAATQITNLGVQRELVQLGFEPVEASYTMHVWFSASPG